MEQNIQHIVENIISENGTGRDRLIPILQAIQTEFNYLPTEALEWVCNLSDITPSQITGVATFYSQFRHIPAGKHTIKVCVGTACHVKGAMQVFDAFKRHLKLEGTNDTDADGLFTLEQVACLGCCTLAPVVQIDDVTYGKVSQSEIEHVVEDFLGKANQDETKPTEFIRSDLKKGEIRLGLGSCCVASGSAEVQETIYQTLSKNHISTNVKQVGCVGMCHQVPLIEIIEDDKAPVLYSKVKPEDVKEIILKHFKPTSLKDRIKTRFLNSIDNIYNNPEYSSVIRRHLDTKEKQVDNFLNKQKHIATELKGSINPVDIQEYKSNGGFVGLQKCLTELTREQIVDQIKISGIRGRGGAGFPTWIKWNFVRNEQTDEKYVICNGDEGDPGAFMDRMLLESFPFRIIEGLTIAAFATGATKAYLYIRAEYPLAVKRIQDAIKECLKHNYLGTNILGSDFSLEMHVFQGAGAFVCGEETALIASMEGERGMPRIRPPFPAKEGLNHFPTLVNNAETLASIAWIIRNGADQFNQIGTKDSCGTKVFALAGKVERGGLIEVPMGITINEIVNDIGGGIQNNKKFKAVQIGGPSGGCIPASLGETPVDFKHLIDIGAMMGSGGLVVLDETDCAVDIARYFLSFTQNQSCGKCVFCRTGTKHMLGILERICAGQGKMEDLDLLEDLAKKIIKGSLCGLGKTAPNPVLTSLRYFRDEYVAHINGHCPAKKCTALIKYTIDESCIGCTKCAQNCPVDAIENLPHQLHSIDQEKCIKCDVCRTVCPIDSVIIIS
jgi:NADH:ubiquinone oxidoreductase subunit F (NADH-binding)/NADH:ubiquinone oxidoreductase subunit E/Pyruvate/2-oxoacid:ferredoxin oxidoreductase delta subunit